MKHGYDYSLHDALVGGQSEMTKRKRWWMRKLAGPDGRRYARLLMDLPALEEL